MSRCEISAFKSGAIGIAGVYARKCGFEVDVFEQHGSPGGLATRRRRGDYVFETWLHWLFWCWRRFPPLSTKGECDKSRRRGVAEVPPTQRSGWGTGDIADVHANLTRQ